MWKKSISSSGSSLFLFILLVPCAICQDSSGGGDYVELSGPNVCLKQELVREEKMVPTREPTQVATKTWCLSIPPRCTTYKTVYKVVYKKETQQVTKMVTRCCEGYGLHANGTCVARCINPCINGECVAPDRCECNAGFSGDTCTQKCPAGRWGPNCNKNCQCSNNAQCDSATGRCDCADGWKGDRCEEACQENRFGPRCQSVCQCVNGASCNPQTGACQCTKGFCGPLCERACAAETKSICDRCQNGGKCVAGSGGNCSCPAGWTGEVCAVACEEGKWGKDCEKSCKTCHNGGHCNPTNGACECAAGYWGANCERECQPGRFGASCLSTCDCEQTDSCDPKDGICHCPNGFRGDRCEKRACPDGKFGKNCNSSCTCGNLSMCHPVDGTCGCLPNVLKAKGGEACSMCCIHTGGDAECYKTCETAAKWLCAPELSIATKNPGAGPLEGPENCVCLGEYSGKECRISPGLSGDSANALAAVGNRPENGTERNTGLIVGLVLAVLVLLIILVLAVFYRRRVRKLQRELASVSYSVSSSDSDTDTLQNGPGDNRMYFGEGSGKQTNVEMKNGETFVKLADPLPKKPIGSNLYVSVPKPNRAPAHDHGASSNAANDQEDIYQSIDYEEPIGGSHEYASIDGNDGTRASIKRPIPGESRAFENQLYNQKNSMYGRAPPSYDAVITELTASTSSRGQ